MAVKFPAPNPPFIAARHIGGKQTPKAIVMHATVSSDNPGTARNIAAMWHGPNSPISSAHYVVDPKEVIQCVGDHTVAFHCGFNTGSLSVEMCDEQVGPANRWADADSKAIISRAATLVAQLCLAYGINPVRPTVAELKKKGPHGIYGHNDSRLAFGNTTHTDPRDFPWGKFLDDVKSEIARIRAERAGVKKFSFKILHAPLHGVSATHEELRNALARKPYALAFSEAYRQSSWLLQRKKWRTTVGSARRDPRGKMVEREVVLMRRKRRGVRHVEHDTIKICEASTPIKIAPERYLQYTVDEVQGEHLAVIALHPHAAVMNAWNSDRAAEFRHAMRILYELVKALRKKYGKNLRVVVLGDLQYRNLDDGRQWTPKWVFDRLGLSYVARGIDWVAYSQNLKRLKAREIPKSRNGQDHPWIEVELEFD